MPEYIAFVRTLPCAARKIRGWHCQGQLDPHHAGERASGHDARRAHDDTAIALCRFHHEALHSLKRPFLDWTREEREAWVAMMIAATRYAWAKAKAREAWKEQQT